MGNLPRTAGGYAESVAPGWQEGPETIRTMLTQARVGYTFLRCSTEEARNKQETMESPPGRESLDRMASLHRLIHAFWDEESKGWIRSCTLEGDPLDRTIDTYDQPFGLLALAEAYKVYRNGGVVHGRITGQGDTANPAHGFRDLAYAPLEGLDRFARDPKGGGYWERRNGTAASPMVLYPQYRRQNPHMHLLEAFLQWDKMDPDHSPALSRLLYPLYGGMVMLGDRR